MDLSNIFIELQPDYDEYLNYLLVNKIVNNPILLGKLNICRKFLQLPCILYFREFKKINEHETVAYFNDFTFAKGGYSSIEYSDLEILINSKLKDMKLIISYDNYEKNYYNINRYYIQYNKYNSITAYDNIINLD